MEYFFLFFGLAFFVFVMYKCNDLEADRHDRKMEYYRAFGHPWRFKQVHKEPTDN